MERRPELRQLLIGISTRRYLPPSGTAGLARSFVRGKRRVPAPPPMITARGRSVVPGGSVGADIEPGLRNDSAGDSCCGTGSITQCLPIRAIFSSTGHIALQLYASRHLFGCSA